MNYGEQPQYGNQPTGTSNQYNPAKIGPNLFQVIVEDDSPEAITAGLFQFFGVDIPLAYIDKTDFANILVFVRTGINQLVRKEPVKNWDDIRIREARKRIIFKGMVCRVCGFTTQDKPTTGEVLYCPHCVNTRGLVDTTTGTIKPDRLAEAPFLFETNEERIEIIREWDIPQLEDAIRTKVYEKMCRARDGFNFNGITRDESYSYIKHDTNQPMYPGGPMPEQKDGKDNKKRGWRP